MTEKKSDHTKTYNLMRLFEALSEHDSDCTLHSDDSYILRREDEQEQAICTCGASEFRSKMYYPLLKQLRKDHSQ